MNRKSWCGILSGASLLALAGGCLPAPVSTLVDERSFTLLPREERGDPLRGVAVLTRLRAQELALAGNPDYRRAEEAILQARMVYYQALGAYSPTIEAGTVVGDSVYHNTGSEFLAGSGGSFYSLTSVQANLLIFDGLAREFKAFAAEHGVRRAEALRADAKRLLVLAAANAFDGILLADAQRAIAEADYTFQNKMYLDARRREQAGVIPRSDVLNFKSKLNQAEYDRVQAEYRYRLGIYALAALMGIPEGTLPEELKFEPVGELPSDPPPVEFCLDRALSSRPDLEGYRELLRIAEYRLYSSYSSFSPTVNAYAGYGFASLNSHDRGRRGALPSIDSFRLDSSSFNYGAVANWTVFNGAIRYNKLRETQAQLASVQYQGAQAWLEVVQQVRSAHVNILHQKKLTAIMDDDRKILREQRDMVERGYLAGEVELTRLNEAQYNLIRSEKDYISARIDLAKAESRLTAAIGESIPSPEQPGTEQDKTR